jgi:hypothetical protein
MTIKFWLSGLICTSLAACMSMPTDRDLRYPPPRPAMVTGAILDPATRDAANEARNDINKTLGYLQNPSLSSEQIGNAIEWQAGVPLLLPPLSSAPAGLRTEDGRPLRLQDVIMHVGHWKLLAPGRLALCLDYVGPGKPGQIVFEAQQYEKRKGRWYLASQVRHASAHTC